MAVMNYVEFARQYKPLTAKEREDMLAYGKQPAENLGSRYAPWRGQSTSRYSGGEV